MTTIFSLSTDRNYAYNTNGSLTKDLNRQRTIHTQQVFAGGSSSAGGNTSPYLPAMTVMQDSTDYVGNLGVTYMPLSVNPQKMEKADASNPDIIHININPTLSKVGAAEIFSHEGYAHAVLYVSNPSNRWAAMHQGTGWGPDPNTDLFEKTIRARKETLNNMKK